jgi:Secretion system C-terminal sorting domain
MIEFQYGVLLSNNIRANMRISNNQLNQSTTVSTATNFGNTGIMVINGLQPTTNVGSCRIYDNEIRRIRNGIWTSRVRNAKIYDNEISFDPAQNFTTASPGTGIRIEGMTNARVSTNNVRNSIAPVSQPAPTLHSKLFGISVENCLNDSVYKNTCFKVGSGIFYKGNNNPSFIACNTLDTCAFGINFNFVNTNGPAISLNKQILYSNTTPTPTGNVWRTNTWDLIGAISVPSNSDWFINNTYTPNVNVIPGTFTNGNQTTNLGSQSDQCSSLLVANPVDVQRDYMLRHIVIDPISYDTLPDEMGYIDRVFAHEMLFDNPDWLYQGKPEDVQYQQYFQNEDLGNTGLFYRAEMALADGNLIAARNFMNAIAPQNEPEANRLEVLEVYINSWGLDSLGFTAAQSQSLFQIATKEYVVSGGNWVYNARNMLFREVHDSTLIRIGRPAQNPVSSGFYPNPATGTVSVNVTILETDVAQLQLIDLAGRMVLQTSLNTGNGNHTFDVSALPAGVYVGRITVNGEIRLTERVSIVKQ